MNKAVVSNQPSADGTRQGRQNTQHLTSMGTASTLFTTHPLPNFESRGPQSLFATMGKSAIGKNQTKHHPYDKGVPLSSSASPFSMSPPWMKRTHSNRQKITPFGALPTLERYLPRLRNTEPYHKTKISSTTSDSQCMDDCNSSNADEDLASKDIAKAAMLGVLGSSTDALPYPPSSIPQLGKSPAGSMTTRRVALNLQEVSIDSQQEESLAILRLGWFCR
jgi:hypothetical protein